MVFHWSLNDKSPQISRTRLNILADLNYAVVWILTTRPLLSKSFSLFTNPLVSVPIVPIIIDRNAIFMFTVFSISILLCDQPRQQILRKLPFFLLLLMVIRSGCLAEIRRSVCISKYQWSLCVSFPRTDSGLFLYHLFVLSNLGFWQLPVDHLAHPVVYYYYYNYL